MEFRVIIKKEVLKGVCEVFKLESIEDFLTINGLNKDFKIRLFTGIKNDIDLIRLEGFCANIAKKAFEDKKRTKAILQKKIDTPELLAEEIFNFVIKKSIILGFNLDALNVAKYCEFDISMTNKMVSNFSVTECKEV